MAQVFTPGLEAAITELRDRPITGTDKGFLADPSGRRVVQKKCHAGRG